MNRRRDVHVIVNRVRCRWRVTQGGRTLSKHRKQATAVRTAKRVARRDCVDSASPYHLEAFVKTEGFVRCDDGDVFHQGLRDDLAVEGISMMRGQIEKPE